MLEHLNPLLDTVHISAFRVPERLREFEIHRRMGIARIISDSILAREGTRDVGFVLMTRFPGLRLVPVIDAPGRDSLVAAMAPGLLFSPADGCPVLLYLDGFRLFNGLESVRTQDLAGIEYYDITSAPPQYRRPGAACKVLLFWSRGP
jgi:hypothetical protein